MRPRWLALLCLVAAAACRKDPPPPDVVAESRSGPVRLEEVEVAIAASARASRSAGRAQPPSEPDVERYRKAAERLVVERALLAEIKDKAKAVEELGDEQEGLYREALLELFHLEQDRVKPIRVDEKDMRAYYDSHRAEFHRPDARMVSHLFRRDEDPRRPEATMAFVAGLKKRAEAGEGFGQLAREYSQSETRLLDGKLGTLGRGRLPKPLEDVVFKLPRGGVSDPIRVKQGAILFHVSDVVEAKQFPFEDVRHIAARRAWERKRAERIAEALGDTRPPEGSVILDAEGLRRQLESADASEVVLQVGKRKVTVKDFKELLDKDRVEERESLPMPAPVERMRKLYDGLRQDALLVAKLEADGFADAPQRRALLNERVRNRGLDRAVRKRIEERIWQTVDRDQATLKRFHQENRFLYQSPLRLKVRTLIGARGDLVRQAAEMEAVRAELVAGRLDLEAAARRLGGSVGSPGWLGPGEIGAMEPKVRSYLLEMNGPGYSIPFQLNQRMNLIFVEKRDEPRLLPYEEVKDRVRQDYRDRHQQDLYERVASDLLKAQGFRFHEDAVKRSLTVSMPKPAAASP